MKFGDIEAILRGLAGEVKETGTGRWSFALVNGATVAVTAQAGAGWMELRAAPAKAAGTLSYWDLLSRNAALEGLCKYVLPPRGTQVRLQAEFPLDGRERLRGYLEAACRGLLTGAAMKSRKTSGSESEGGGSVSELCAEAGWPHSEKDRDRARVELDAGGYFCQALVERRGGEIRSWVELARPDGFDEAGQKALAIFLLRSAGAIRFARAATREEGRDVAAGFEVALARQPAASDLNHALASLSVACRACGREAGELHDPEVAASYLLLHSESAFDQPGRRASTAGTSKED